MCVPAFLVNLVINLFIYFSDEYVGRTARWNYQHDPSNSRSGWERYGNRVSVFLKIIVQFPNIFAASNTQEKLSALLAQPAKSDGSASSFHFSSSQLLLLSSSLSSRAILASKTSFYDSSAPATSCYFTTSLNNLLATHTLYYIYLLYQFIGHWVSIVTVCT